MVCFFSVKGRFSSSLGVMLSMLGSVVGTGNIWRFPRIMATHAEAGGWLSTAGCYSHNFIMRSDSD